jgi:hypothetical protein
MHAVPFRSSRFRIGQHHDAEAGSVFRFQLWNEILKRRVQSGNARCQAKPVSKEKLYYFVSLPLVDFHSQSIRP